MKEDTGAHGGAYVPGDVPRGSRRTRLPSLLYFHGAGEGMGLGGVHLTSTVVGSGQANRQDACQEKAVRSNWATPTSLQPTSCLWLAMAAGGRRGQRPAGSEMGETARRFIQNLPFTVFTGAASGTGQRSLTWVPPRQRTVWNGDGTQRPTTRQVRRCRRWHMQGHGGGGPETALKAQGSSFTPLLQPMWCRCRGVQDPPIARYGDGGQGGTPLTPH